VKVFLVPFRPLARGRVPPGWTGYAPLRERAAHGESITVFGGPGGPGQTVSGLTAQDIVQGRAVVDEAGSGPSRHAMRFVVVVPDGVVKVSVVFARAPVRHGNTVEQVDEETPRGNVATFQDLGTRPAKPWLMTWESRTGKVIKRIALPTDIG
jgi:hypothetical protein